MPVAASLTGTLTRLASGGSAAAGTLSVIGHAENPATGTLLVDRTLYLAFAAPVRLTRADVRVDGELMGANLVDTVTIEETLDDPIQYATFTLSDKRTAYFDPASLANGKRSVEIDLWCGPPGNVRRWDWAFAGDTETVTNSMPYRPRGQFRAVSRAAAWVDTKGCLNLPAMSGLTRGDILAVYAESMGITLLNPGAIGGAVVRKKLDIADKSLLDLIKEFGEIEGMISRPVRLPLGDTGGVGLEILNEDEILSGDIVFAFDESNTSDVPETTPNRPTTDWVLSGTQIAGIPKAGATVVTATTDVPGTDTNGYAANTVTEITTDAGVEIKRVVTHFATVIRPGVSVLPYTYEIVSRVTSETKWSPFIGLSTDADGAPIAMPSSRLEARRVTTEMLVGVPCAAAGGIGYTWTDSSKMTKAYAELEVVEVLDETYTWDEQSCRMLTALSVRQQLYSPLATYGTAFFDGTIRRDTAYALIEVLRDQTYYNPVDPDGSWGVQDVFGQRVTVDPNLTIISRWYQAIQGEEIYVQAVTNLRDGSGGAARLGSSTDGGILDSSRIASLVPLTTISAPPAFGSEFIAQVFYEVIQSEVDATQLSRYARRVDSPGMLQFPESLDELDAVARRRIRRAMSDELAIPHRLIPFLRPGDHVSVTNHARSLVDADAYVYSIQRTVDVANGGMSQLTTVRIPPTWI